MRSGAERRRRAGEPRARKATARGRATRSPSRCARASIRSRGATTRRPRSPRSRPARRCSRRSSPRCTPADDSTRLEAARQVKRVFETTPGVVDVDWTVEAPQQKRVVPRGPGARGRGRRERRADHADALPRALGRADRPRDFGDGARGNGDRPAPPARAALVGGRAARASDRDGRGPAAARALRHRARRRRSRVEPGAEGPASGDLRDRRRRGRRSSRRCTRSSR